MTILIIATRNPHKVQEIRNVLTDHFGYRTLSDFPSAPAVMEDAPDFAGNTTKKSLELARWLSVHPDLLQTGIGSTVAAQAFCLADDSGLEVDALDGAPGVYSARFAAVAFGEPGLLDRREVGPAGNTSDEANNTKLLRLLQRVSPEQRKARFRCVLALAPVLLPNAETSGVCYADDMEIQTQLFTGTCEGRIDTVPRGTKGFGYDPLFIPDGFTQSFAELGEGVKNEISHRAKALAKLKLFLTPR